MFLSRIVLLLILAAACITGNPHSSGAVEKKGQLADAARLVRYINKACSGDQIEAHVMRRICIPALKHKINLMSRCSTCDVYVDPMCMDDCPQFLNSIIFMRSRCSTCDVYIDPMCMLDCPQFFGRD